MPILKTYYPMPRFPAVSLSGAVCHLNCRHCNGVYLGSMKPVETPEALMRTCARLRKDNALGILISGGSEQSGAMLNLTAMLDAIRRVKQETGLILNIHPGLLDQATARNLAVDFASLEIPSDDTIANVFGLRNVFGLHTRTADYVATYNHLWQAGIEVVPHICVYEGNEDELLEAIAGSEDAHPRTIVVIVFSPTKHTDMADVPPPTSETVAGVITRIKTMFPTSEIALGCMRPRRRKLREEMEIAALQAGVTRMELPTQKTLRYARERGYEIVGLDACCALPEAYETRALRR